MKIEHVLFIGNFQLELAREIAKRGIKVNIIVDKSNKSSSKKLDRIDFPANIYEAISLAELTIKQENLEKFFEEINANSCLIIPREEKYLRTSIEIAEKYSLRPAKNVLQKLTPFKDKVSLRGHLSEINSDFITKSEAISNLAELERISHKFDLPFILKPSNQSGSKGVFLIDSIDTLRKTVREIKQNANLTSSEWLVEDYIQGKQFSIDAIVDWEGKIKLYPLVEQKTIASSLAIDFSQTPVSSDKQTVAHIRESVEKLIQEFQLKMCVLHIEIKYDKEHEKIGVIEINPRMGGFRQTLYKYAYGFDYITGIVNTISGSNLKSRENMPKRFVRVFYIYADELGKFTAFTRATDNLEGIEEIKPFAREGDIVGPPELGFPKLAQVTIVAENHSQLDLKQEKISTLLKPKILADDLS
ncbi:MAG: ATP-grasp domain-containing protein [Candidatus Dojkabacteria bacterium]